MLMLNESGTAGFSIPSAETFMGARVLSNNNTRTMAIAVNPPATDVAVMNGFSVYTSEAGANAGGQPIYRRYSFAANGELSGAPSTLSGNELIKAELEVGLHFTTNGSTGVRISQQSPNLWHMPNGHPLPLYTLDS